MSENVTPNIVAATNAFLDTLSEEQQNAWLAVMQATLSQKDYNRLLADWNADEVLATQSSGGGSGPGGGQLLFDKQYYWIAIIGAPSETDPWQWQWDGHHVTDNATIAGQKIALTPGHDKTLVGAYLVRSRGTVRHTVSLGAIVTFTHTSSVFVIGLLALFASQFIVPNVLVPLLEILSGLLVLLLGMRLAWQRC